MKKILIIALLLLTCACFAACGGNTTTIDQTWASTETLSFSVYDTERGAGNIAVGEANFTTTTILTAEEKASGANTKVTSVVTVDTQTTTTIFYANVYTVLSLERTFIDTADPNAGYTLNGKHDGKNFVYETTYTADGRTEKGKIKVGSGNYSDFEFLYFFIRCYDPSGLPSVTVPDPATGEAVALTCSLIDSKASVKTETELGTVTCNEVAVSRKSTPVGASSYVYYMHEEDYVAGEGSIVKSKRFPVKIVENNVSFVLKDFTPKK